VSKQDWIQDGMTSLAGGVSSGIEADQILQDQAAWAVNGSLRNGRFRVRPPFKERLTLPSGNIQGADIFESSVGHIVTYIDGYLYRVVVDNEEFSYERVDTEFQGSTTALTVWSEMTPGYMVFQNNVDNPVIYDGGSARRAVDGEIPKGRMMAYGNGRLGVAISDLKMAFGDIAGVTEDSHLKFTETDFLLGGGTFTMKSRITGMSYLPSNDGTTGYGPLLVGGRDWMNAFQTNITDRDLWQSTVGFNSTFFREIGFLSHDSIVEVNQDLYFRDGAGHVRSIRQAVADVADPGLTPMSHEMHNLFDFESDDMMADCPAIYFQNRLLVGASPYFKGECRTGYKDIAALNFSTVETMRGKTPPAWEGEWEGVYFSKMVEGKFRGKSRAFIIGHHPDGSNRLYEIEREDSPYYIDSYQGASDPETSPIEGYLDTKSFDFGSPFAKKRIERLDLWTSEIKGDTQIEVYFRTDNRHDWQIWDTFNADADMEYADGDFTFPGFTPLRPRSQSSRKTLTPGAYFSETVGLSTFFTIQIRLKVTGAVQIDRLLLNATQLSQEQYSADNDLVEADAKNPISFMDTEYKIPYTPLQIDQLVDENGDYYVDENADNYTVADV